MILPRSGRIAWLFGSRPPLAVPPAESPSTRKSSHLRGVAVFAVDEFAGQARSFQRVFAPREVARFFRCVAGALRLHALFHDRARVLRILFEKEVEAFGDEARHDAAYPRVAEFRFRLALELRILQLHRDDGRQAFHDVVGRKRVVGLFEETALARVRIDGVGDGLTEALQVHSALDRPDIIGVGENLIGIRVGVLHRHLDVDAVALRVRRNDRR